MNNSGKSYRVQLAGAHCSNHTADFYSELKGRSISGSSVQLPGLRDALTNVIEESSRVLGASCLASLSPITSSIQKTKANRAGLYRYLCCLIDTGMEYLALSPNGYYHSHATVKLSAHGWKIIQGKGIWKNGGLFIWTEYGGIHFRAIDDHKEVAKYITSERNMPDSLFLVKNLKLYRSFNCVTLAVLGSRFRILRGTMRNTVNSPATDTEEPTQSPETNHQPLLPVLHYFKVPAAYLRRVIRSTANNGPPYPVGKHIFKLERQPMRGGGIIASNALLSLAGCGPSGLLPRLEHHHNLSRVLEPP